MLKQMQEQLERLHSSKFNVPSHAFENLNADEKKAQYQLVTRILDENLLDYYFQPIVSAVDGSVYAFEALMRSRTETEGISAFYHKICRNAGAASDVERATFLNVLGLSTKKLSAFGNAKVFINSIPGVSVGEEATSELDKSLAAHAGKVVVELTEEAELKDSELETAEGHISKSCISTSLLTTTAQAIPM